jgi:hypothetical protein
VVDSWRRYRRDPNDKEERPRRWNPLVPKKVSHQDLVIPARRGRLTLFGACVLCAAGFSILWVYFPMLIVAIMLDHDLGDWIWGSMAGFTSVFSVALYVHAAAEEEKQLDTLYG